MKAFRIAQILVTVSSLLFVIADDPCEQIYSPSLDDGTRISASSALDCLKSVPLDNDLAKETMRQLRQYMQFYSAQAYFAKPPEPKLELVPVELNKTLDTIEKNVASGVYNGFYSFSKDIFDMFGLYRDGHVQFLPACLVPFYFEHDYPLISLGSSPAEIPQIYLAHIDDDGLLSVGDRVVEINDGDPVEFLTKLANTSPWLDWVDPDARFNNLMVSMTSGKWSPGAFARRMTLEDQFIGLKISTANGTNVVVEWHAALSSAIPGADAVKSSEALKSYCSRPDSVIQEIYEQYNQPAGGNSNTGHKRYKRELPEPAYKKKLRVRSEEEEGDPPFPKPWKALEGGEFAVYHLDDQTAVLVIRSFDGGDLEADDFMMTAHTLVKEAITYLTANHYERLVIDVTGNGGGFVGLGIDTVRQLFPDKDHFFAVNMRWNPAMATMLSKGLDANDTYWDYRTFNDEKGKDIESVEEFLGPVHRDGDYFTPIMRSDVTESAKSSGLVESYTGRQPFTAENIVLVSSGACGSTCAVFSEALMEVGVHTVVFGGRPKRADMQLVGGIKGSQVLRFDDIAGFAYYFLEDKLKDYDFIPTPFKINLAYGSLNFQNSWRKGEEELPIEFLYDPAEYRLAYTAAMTQNMTVMWEAARDVVWGSNHDDLGVAGSSWTSWAQVIWEKIRPAYSHDSDL